MKAAFAAIALESIGPASAFHPALALIRQRPSCLAGNAHLLRSLSYSCRQGRDPCPSTVVQMTRNAAQCQQQTEHSVTDQQQTSLSNVHIRSYRTSDEASVHRIFAESMIGVAKEGFPVVAADLRVKAAGVCAALSAVTFAAGGGAVLVVLAALIPYAAFLYVVYANLKSKLVNYVNSSLSDDLKDISTFYMAAEKSNFWVAVSPAGKAEKQEQVLGCVALQFKKDDTKYAGWGELRRMAVGAAGRRRGIASQLNGALLDHAKEKGMRGVFLTTSNLQTGAIGLYNRLGYRQVSAMSMPSMKAVEFLSFEQTL